MRVRLPWSSHLTRASTGARGAGPAPPVSNNTGFSHLQAVRRGPGVFGLFVLCIVTILLMCGAPPAAMPAATAAQPALPPLPQQLRFEHLSLAEGLSDGRVWDVLQDRQGFLWFATYDGLDRYDGYQMRVYRPDPADPRSLSGSAIRVLFEDRSGTLWVGTWRNGLNRYDRQTDQFTRYQHDPANPSSLAGNAVRAILEDRAGNLWIGTDGGLSRFDRVTGRFTHYRHDPANPQSLSHNDVYSVYQDRGGALWVGTFGGGLNRFDPATEHFTHYRHDPANPDSLSIDKVYTAIFEDRAGNLWIGTWDGGLERLDRASGRFTHYRHDPAEPDSLSHDRVVAIYEDQAGDFWIGTWGGGLERLDRASGRFTHYHHDLSDPYSLSHERVVGISEDRSGIIWFATEGGGVSYLDRYRHQFTYYRHRPGEPASLSPGDVIAIYEDRSGAVWLGTFGGGLNQLDRRTGRFTHYRHVPGDPTSLSSDIVSAIFEDRDGVLWVGTANGGLNRLDRRTGTFVHCRHVPGDSTSLSSDMVNTIIEDREGMLWIGTVDGGLNRLDRQTGRFVSYQHDPEDPTSIGPSTIRTILEDQEGTLWIGTRGGGLNRFERQTGTFTHYRHDPADPHSLSADSIYLIYQDRAGRFWVGTEEGGLNQFDQATGRFVVYRRRDGLPSDTIFGILEDYQGNLWLSTSQGLAKFNPMTGHVRIYDVRGGIPITEFFPSSAHHTRGGELLFGGVNGFIAFDPAQIVDDSYVPPIVLTDFQLANRPVAIGAGSPLRQAIDQTAELTLSYRDRVLSIGFAALDYRAPSQNRYRYKLEGFDQEWIEVDSTRRIATYTNLDPGSYVFHVTGSNGDGVWNEVGRSLHITITPPWWQTLWFRVPVLLLCVGAGAGLYRWRARARAAAEAERKRSEAHLQQMQKIEGIGRLAGGVAHDFNNLLTAITGYTDLALADLPPDDPLASDLREIAKAADRGAALTRQLLAFARQQAIEPRVLNLNDLILDLEKLLRRLIGEDIELVTLPAPDLWLVKVDPSRIEQVLINLVVNARDAMPEGGKVTIATANMWVEASTIREHAQIPPGPYVVLSVRDTGMGIAPEVQARIFEPFFTTKAVGQGTGLGLATCYGIVTQHGGHLGIASTVGQGTTMTVYLPRVAATPAALSAQDGPEQLPMGAETVLVVEDEPAVRALAVRTLRTYGYTVLEASNGEEGLRMASKHTGAIQLVVTDIVMPQLGGPLLVDRLRASHPNIRVLFMSGYSDNAMLQRARTVGGSIFLQKPFPPALLVQQVRAALDAEESVKEYGDMRD